MATNPTHAKGPYIGIDFGTTKTMVAEFDPAKRFPKVRKLGRQSDEMPTSMYVAEDGQVLFGDYADDEGGHDCSGYIRRFKMDLGKTTKRRFGRQSVKPVHLTERFLADLRTRLESEVCHQPVERAVITVPATFGPAQRKDLEQAASGAGFREVVLLSEPEAAGLAYCEHNTDLSNKQRFLVADWGGGTFDLAVLERDEYGNSRVLDNYVDGLSGIGGEDLDDLFLEVAPRLLAGFPPLNRQARQHFARYRRHITEIKKALSVKPETTAGFVLENGDLVRRSVTRSELETIIGEKVLEGARKVADLVKRCRADKCDLDYILLAGGTSQIPMIARQIGETTELPCRPWTEGRESIALGAAIHAFRLFGVGSPDSLPLKAEQEHSPQMPQEQRKPVTPKEPKPNPERTCPKCGATLAPGVTRCWAKGCSYVVQNDDGSHQQTGKLATMSRYRALLESDWVGDVITDETRSFLENRRAQLGLSEAEGRSLEIQVLGAPLAELEEPDAGPDNATGLRKPAFRIGIEKSKVGLQVLAMDEAARADLQLDEFIAMTHFPMVYVVTIENTSRGIVHSVRVSLKSSEGKHHSILVPCIPPGAKGRLSLTTADFEGWCVTPGDVLSVDAPGSAPVTFEVPLEKSWKTDSIGIKPSEFPCIIRLRKAMFASTFVLRVFNNKARRMRINALESPAGTLGSPIEVQPFAEAEIGWMELSENANFKLDDRFEIEVEGCPRLVQGVIAQRQAKGGGTAWKVLAALGGIALAAAGAG